jgi:predicted Holliday junction resolvase-like endonuclease
MSTFCEAHEARLARLEEASKEAAAYMSANKYRLDTISDQITSLASQMSDSFENLNERVDVLALKQTAQGHELKVAEVERKRHRARQDAYKKFGLAVLLALAGALAAKFGDYIWTWGAR